MLCFKSNYKTTSLPDATPCKTILSLNIIDNTALPYCLCGILVYHVVQIPCKQEANWTALCWTAARSSTVWCTCSEMQWSEPKNEGGEWFSTPPPARCANPARCATPRSRRQSCCCLIRQLLASPPPSSNTPALHIPPGSFLFDRQQRQQRRSHLLFVPLFTWNAEGILKQ